MPASEQVVERYDDILIFHFRIFKPPRHTSTFTDDSRIKRKRGESLIRQPSGVLNGCLFPGK